MKKRVVIFLLFIVQNTESVAPSLKRGRGESFYQKNMQLCLNTRDSFGKTHFIKNYEAKNIVQPAPETSLVSDDIKNQKYKKQKTATPAIDENCLTQAFFTSKHNVRKIFSDLIDGAKKSIRIAAFTLTDSGIAEQLKKAHKAGISVEIITDLANISDAYSQIKDLAQTGIQVWYYKSKGSRNARMHHKIIILDGCIVITGSANLTKSGQKNNIENIVVIREKETVNHYNNEFEELKPLCEAY